MGKKKIIREYIEPIVIAILIALFIRTFIVQAFKIPSSSMEPTLQVGDHLLVNKFIYGIKIPFTHIRIPHYNEPRRGDIVVFGWTLGIAFAMIPLMRAGFTSLRSEPA